MADDAEKGEEAVSGGINKKLLLLILLGVLVVGGGAGFFFMSGGEPEKTAKAHNDEDGEVEATADSEPGFVGPVIDLEPFVLNLADRDQLRYLKVSIKVQLDRPEEQTDFTAKQPAIRDALLVLLTSKESRALRTVDGKMLVRDEIGGRVNTIMKKGKVKQVFFTDFIIQ
ncbi:flagellar basal body-associated FliL family protein [Candidatus Nitronereus thalassa]|uniref:Flagellar protein FliL n=1 Tax=Candidatus Nitronereus thalassa TaxID=3020898 RepID=A0ABU3K6A1_9BACT|nr:flagellar basal body-associated FliL family protein [Candidatus Nitronereus thalassa]MDT7041911.1 flagellar basal body-associated FliL family protein [Candidatus Nitronereus thalassa]